MNDNLQITDGIEEINQIPIRNEITVLPADKPKQLKLGWVIREYSGGEVYGFDVDDSLIEIPLTKESDMYIGRKISVPTIFGYVVMEVVNEDGKLVAMTTTKRTLANLEFAKDDRLCWISSCVVNLKGIKKSSKSTTIDVSPIENK